MLVVVVVIENMEAREGHDELFILESQLGLEWLPLGFKQGYITFCIC